MANMTFSSPSEAKDVFARFSALNVGDWLVYIRIQKTGSTSCGKMLADHFPSKLYVDERPGRSHYPGTWRRAIAGVCKHKAYLVDHSDFKNVSGIGKAIQQIVALAPWESFKPSQSPSPVRVIAAACLKVRCEALGIAPQDRKKISDKMGEIQKMGLTFPDVHYDMTKTLAMDLETCSVANTNGRFLVYAVGFRYMDKRVRLVAHTADDLRGGLMWKALQSWQQIAESLNVGCDGDGKRNALYVYAHNGSKFDCVAAMHSILAYDTDVRPTNWRAMGNSSASSGAISFSATAALLP